MTTQITPQAVRVYDSAIRRVVIVPDLQALVGAVPTFRMDHGYDALMRCLDHWTDLATATDPWYGLLIVAPHSDTDDLMRDENFIGMWSQWAAKRQAYLTVTVFSTETNDDGTPRRAHNQIMSFSDPHSNGREAHVSIFPRNFMAALEGIALEEGEPWQAVNPIGVDSAWGEVFEHIFGATLQSSPVDPTLPENWIGGDHLIVPTDRDHDGSKTCGEIVILGVDDQSNLAVHAAPVNHSYDPAGHLP